MREYTEFIIQYTLNKLNAPQKVITNGNINDIEKFLIKKGGLIKPT